MVLYRFVQLGCFCIVCGMDYYGPTRGHNATCICSLDVLFYTPQKVFLGWFDPPV